MWEGFLRPSIGQKILLLGLWLAVSNGESIPTFGGLYDLQFSYNYKSGQQIMRAVQYSVHTAVTFIVGSFPVHFELSKRNWIVSIMFQVFIHSYTI